MAPVVYKGKVIVGITGVGYGLHLDSDRPGAPIGAVIGIAGQSQRAGFYAAFDAQTGKRIWQFDSTPASGWEGEFRTHHPGRRAAAARYRPREGFARTVSRTPGSAGAARPGPRLPSIPTLGLVYLGVGNPSPQMDDLTRPGDNLYTVSLVAVDVETGKLRWYYQQVPHDMWGYDVASPAVLFDALHRRRARPGGRTGQQDRLAVRAGPARRQAALQVRGLRAAEQSVRTAHPGRNRHRAGRRRRRKLVAGLLRRPHRSGLRGGPAHADPLHGQRHPGHRRQAGDALHGPGAGRRAEVGHAHRHRPVRRRQDPLAGEDRRSR